MQRIACYTVATSKLHNARPRLAVCARVVLCGGIRVSRRKRRHALPRAARGWMQDLLLNALGTGAHAVSPLRRHEQPLPPMFFLRTLGEPTCTGCHAERSSHSMTRLSHARQEGTVAYRHDVVNLIVRSFGLL